MYTEYDEYVELGNSGIPKEMDNQDYIRYLQWIEEGNTPLIGELKYESYSVEGQK